MCSVFVVTIQNISHWISLLQNKLRATTQYVPRTVPYYTGINCVRHARNPPHTYTLTNVATHSNVISLSSCSQLVPKLIISNIHFIAPVLVNYIWTLYSNVIAKYTIYLTLKALNFGYSVNLWGSYEMGIIADCFPEEKSQCNYGIRIVFPVSYKLI